MLKRFLKRRVRSAAQLVGGWYERRLNEDIAISIAMAAHGSQPTIDYPGTYVGFLRECIRPQSHHLKEIKAPPQQSATEAARRFENLLQVLSSNVPPLPLSTAQEIGHIADTLLATTQTFVYGGWIADVGSHAQTSSSSARQGRLISCIVRLMKSAQCLELGTAYGLSALFALAALQRNGDGGHLTTLEGGEVQFSFAARLLREKHTGSVSCHKGMTYEALPAIVPTLGKIDFLYHDAGHSRKDYIVDYGLVEPVLASGAAVLIDDINWNNPKFYEGDPQTYAGWLAIVENERVERAVEVDGKLGLLLLK